VRSSQELFLWKPGEAFNVHRDCDHRTLYFERLPSIDLLSPLYVQVGMQIMTRTHIQQLILCVSCIFIYLFYVCPGEAANTDSSANFPSCPDRVHMMI
jgi:hypothetical protein